MNLARMNRAFEGCPAKSQSSYLLNETHLICYSAGDSVVVKITARCELCRKLLTKASGTVNSGRRFPNK
jgi:hypothetical protein